MRKYIKPGIEITYFETESIMTVSNNFSSLPDGIKADDITGAAETQKVAGVSWATISGE
jgi:hypothetical protein